MFREPYSSFTIRTLGLRVGPAGLVVRLNPESVRTECVARGWSLAMLRRRAGLSRPTVAKAVRGLPVRPQTAWRIQSALGAEVVASDADAGH